MLKSLRTEFTIMEHNPRQHKIDKTIRASVIGVLLSFAFSFALVPLYNTFCNITGLNGKIDLNDKAQALEQIDHSRIINVEFTVNDNPKAPFIFKTEQQTIRLKPGQVNTISYYIENLTDRAIVAQAIPSITPGIAASHLKKIECFCFEQQHLEPKQAKRMNLEFYLSKKLPEPVKRLTLSYTVFDVTKNLHKENI